MKIVVSVIIPAAGESRRFNKGSKKKILSKLLLLLNGKSLLAHSLSAFHRCPQVCELIIAVQPRIKKMLKEKMPSDLSFPITFVPGGKTRAESVWHALKKVSKKSTHVMTHDGARPFLSSRWIERLIREIGNADGIVLGRHAVPTIKRLAGDGKTINETLDRRELFEAETPQMFKKSVLVDAYKALGKHAFTATDDASLVEWTGGTVKTVAHEGSNLKITSSDDFELAKKMMHDGNIRFGLGFDSHCLARGRVFYLGGVRLNSSIGPVGHSDGDPLLHAIIDGMFGALGMGDIGDFFPDSSKAYHGIRSTVLARKALSLIREKGYEVSQIDSTVMLDAPKLSSMKKKIQLFLANIFELPASQVGVKAKTREGLVAKNTEPSVLAHALVLLKTKENL